MNRGQVIYQRCPVCRPEQEEGIKIYSPKELAEIVASELSENRTFKCIRCKLRVYVTPENQLKKPKWDRKDSTRKKGRISGRIPKLKEGELQETINTGSSESDTGKYGSSTRRRRKRRKSGTGSSSRSQRRQSLDTINIDPEGNGAGEKPEGKTLSPEEFQRAQKEPLDGTDEEADTVVPGFDQQLYDSEIAAARLIIQQAVREGAILDGRFKLANPLDEQGATSVVVLAKDMETKKSVVVKFTAESFIGGEDGELCRRRIDRVYEIQSMLSESPHVITPIALLKDEGYGYVTVEEYVEAVPLSNALKGGGTLNQTIAVEIIVQLGSVLELAREKGCIVHRDIKPANVMIHISEDGAVHVWLIDWGIARSNQKDKRDTSKPFAEELTDVDRKKVLETLTKQGTVVGTPHFMAPEQLDGGRVTGQSDIYGLAALIYCVLCGSPPFKSDSLAGLIDMVMLQDPQPLKKRAREKKRRVSKAFSQEISKALSKEPHQRHETAEEFVKAIQQTQMTKSRGAARMREPGYLEKMVARVGGLFWRKKKLPGKK